MALAIRTRGLVKRFGETAAVDGLDLEVPTGTVFAFLGPNGAGKTTTLHLLLGLLDPDEGHVEVLGHDVDREALAVRRRCGVLLEHDGVYERLTVARNLDLWGRLHGLTKDQRTERAHRLLSELGLVDRLKDRVGTLSRGMKRKLAIARALLPEPDLLILDEPTVGLDPRSVVEIRSRLKALARERGTTVFLTTHNLNEAERVADRVALIHRGKIIASGTPQELAKRYGAHRALILGDRLTPDIAEACRSIPGVLEATTQGADDTLRLRLQDGVSLAPIIENIVSLGGRIEATNHHRESLEEIFLLLTRTPGKRTARRPRPIPAKATIPMGGPRR